MRHRRMPLYSPSTDALGLEIWLDASDSSTSSLLDTTGAAITNGATVGTMKSKISTARSFTQWGALARPTWVTGVCNGLAGVHCNSQILATKTVTNMVSLSGQTWLVAAKFVSGSGTPIGESMTDTVVTHAPTISEVQMRSQSIYAAGGRRTGADAIVFATGNSIPASNNHITGCAFDYANAKISLFESGVEGVQGQTFQTAGTTGAGDPYAIGIGGFPQQNGATFTNGSPGDHYLLEALCWPSVLTPDQLVGPHTYLRLKWGIN